GRPERARGQRHPIGGRGVSGGGAGAGRGPPRRPGGRGGRGNPRRGHQTGCHFCAGGAAGNCQISPPFPPPAPGRRRRAGPRRRRTGVWQRRPLQPRRAHLPHGLPGHRSARGAVQPGADAGVEPGGGTDRCRGRAHVGRAYVRVKETKMRKTVELRGASRRDFIRWGIYVGGLLGVRPWRIFEVLEDTGGKALAAQAACLSTNRSVHIVAGNGGQAWFNLLWPHVDVAQSGNDRFAFHAFGEGGLLAGTDKPLYLGPQAPWRSYGISKAVTAFMAGTNEGHQQRPISSSTIGTGVGLFAACAALQSSAPTLVPVIGISNLPYGNAPGAPSVATVPSADGMVGLFDSAASRMGGVLSAGGDAALFEAYYKAYLSLRAVATPPTITKSCTPAQH